MHSSLSASVCTTSLSSAQDSDCLLRRLSLWLQSEQRGEHKRGGAHCRMLQWAPCIVCGGVFPSRPHFRFETVKASLCALSKQGIAWWFLMNSVKTAFRQGLSFWNLQPAAPLQPLGSFWGVEGLVQLWVPRWSVVGYGSLYFFFFLWGFCSFTWQIAVRVGGWDLVPWGLALTEQTLCLCLYVCVLGCACVCDAAKSSWLWSRDSQLNINILLLGGTRRPGDQYWFIPTAANTHTIICSIHPYTHTIAGHICPAKARLCVL